MPHAKLLSPNAALSGGEVWNRFGQAGQQTPALGAQDTIRAAASSGSQVQQGPWWLVSWLPALQWAEPNCSFLVSMWRVHFVIWSLITERLLEPFAVVSLVLFSTPALAHQSGAWVGGHHLLCLCRTRTQIILWYSGEDWALPRLWSCSKPLLDISFHSTCFYVTFLWKMFPKQVKASGRCGSQRTEVRLSAGPVLVD